MERFPNWTEKEKLFVIRKINESYSRLFGKFKGAAMTNKEKDCLWQSLTDEFNSSGIAQCKRTVENVKTMYKNTKARAKSKEGDRKKTGGGPFIALTAAEEESVVLLRNNPQMVGIGGGLESSAICSTAPCNDASEENENDNVENGKNPKAAEETTTVSAITSEPQPLIEEEASIRVSGKGTKRKQDELYQLELVRAKLEGDLLKQRLAQERDLFVIKKQILEESRQQDRELFTLKKELLTSNIARALDEGLINIES
ncbi:uncharacterized protein LOC132727317 isoform X2 [Ruditapes philippinarum]|uniref:uncharacterized protein LOC132727317 isoform X2 n=1 Tax=Ruditapes philippinarum TaxID=129788 RepID=UPI00295B1480|nr:uncharacterized protein LOC132727317 isoform X2 [Ruditapes philippinarum]